VRSARHRWPQPESGRRLTTADRPMAGGRSSFSAHRKSVLERTELECYSGGALKTSTRTSIAIGYSGGPN
jgi:hypothetical protein